MPRSDMSGNHESPLTITHDTLREKTATAIHQQTGLKPSPRHYYGWLGLECPTVHAAVWMMRLLTVSNALARREDTTVFLPINPTTDPEGKTALRLTTQTHRHAVEQKIMQQD